MAKKKAKKSVTPAPETVKRGPGRPSTFPPNTEVVAFPTRVSKTSLVQLREIAAGRQSPFGLDHNSIGAEMDRIVGQAHAKFMSAAASAEKRRASRKPTKTASVADTVPALGIETAENASS